MRRGEKEGREEGMKEEEKREGVVSSKLGVVVKRKKEGYM